MKFVILTGMSGSGKTNALKVLEDIGYYCVDNLPVELVPDFVDLYQKTKEETEKIKKVVLGIDIRIGKGLKNISSVLKEIQDKNVSFKVLFLDASDETIIKRYKETRRLHPLAMENDIADAIKIEREELRFLREKADFIIDTSNILAKELKKELVGIFADGRDFKNMYVNIRSFGFMYGLPKDADLLFDVRFLPNPYYIKDLRLKSGAEKEVKEYVFSDKNAGIFLDKLENMINFLIPLYIAEGKNQLVICIGCTGGQHRSVAVADELAKKILNNHNIGLKLEHIDCDRNIKRIS